MTVNLRELKITTFHGLENLCNVSEKFADIQGCISFEQAAALSYLLKYVADDEDVFPSGKWATIQRLQDLCDKAAEARLK